MTIFHLHLISDSTGGTLDSLVKACLAQFEGVKTELHFWPLISGDTALKKALQGVRAQPGMVLYTIVNRDLSRVLETECRSLGIQALSVLQPVLKMMGNHFKQETLGKAGLQHALDAAYFARMDAVDYALHHDDGQQYERDLNTADVILVGVSRTSKTPTCIYLANRGVRAANIPFVPGVPIPDHVLDMEIPLFVGLTAAPARLIEIRRHRLTGLGEQKETDYLDLEKVKEEVRDARKLCQQRGWPIIDVTRRSVEETAAEIHTLLQRRRDKKTSAV